MICSHLRSLLALGSCLFSSVLSANHYLTKDQMQRYHRDGYLIIENFLTAKECDDLQKSADKLVEAFEPGDSHHIFGTGDKQPKDEYFLKSGENISFFFENDAFTSDGNLVRPKKLAINKMGHALHELDPTFRAVSQNKKLEAISKELGIKDPRLMQSMYIFKQPRIGGAVDWHQDGTFLYTDKENTLGFWFALEDATTENGCLWAIPGDHKIPLKSRFGRTADGKGTWMTHFDKTPFDVDRKVPLLVPKGALIVLHSRVPHMSLPNRSEKSRHAYTLHVTDGTSHYPADNWLQRNPDNPAPSFE